MDLPLLIDKPLGATPLKALELLRRAISIPESVKLAYAGRLDPMASGLIPVLRGEQLQHQEDYWHLSKRYESTVLIGIRTDSHDVLGMPERFPMETPNAERITAVVRGLVGKVYLPVPVFSSHRHEGKPPLRLFLRSPTFMAEDFGLFLCGTYSYTIAYYILFVNLYNSPILKDNWLMKIISWNVNGIRASFKKGALAEAFALRPDILCIQETKAELSQLPLEIAQPGAARCAGQPRGAAGEQYYR
jgi:hypothetical protein